MAHDHSHAAVSGTAGSADGAGPDGKGHVRRLVATLSLTGTVFVAEVVGAVITGSLALFVDAGHMLTDLSVLAASTVTAILMRRKPTGTRTWGWARLEVITATGGAVALLFVGLYALIEAVMRLLGLGGKAVQDPVLLLVFGVIGLLANIGSMLILMGQRGANMNMRAAFLEVVNDALGSVAVIASAVLVMTIGWRGFDSIAGGVIALMMIPRAIGLLRSGMRVLLEETPEGLDLAAVRRHLEGVPNVVAVHDLHASTVATGMPRLTAHIVVESLAPDDYVATLGRLHECLREHFPVSVEHTTFQLEPRGYRTYADESVHK